MMQQVNTFQISILKWLNIFVREYTSVDFQKSAWLSGHLTDTVENIDSWMQQLVEAGYILEEIKETAPSILMMSYGKGIAPTFSLFSITQKGRNCLASLEMPEAKDTPLLSTPAQENEKTVNSFLKCLKGQWQGNKIMKDADFERMKDYACYIVQNNSLPQSIEKIPPTNISDAFIRRTFYELYKQFRPKIDRNIWIKFLHKTFQQFNCTPTTTSAKFSQYPDSSNYDIDKNLIE